MLQINPIQNFLVTGENHRIPVVQALDQIKKHRVVRGGRPAGMVEASVTSAYDSRRHKRDQHGVDPVRAGQFSQVEAVVSSSPDLLLVWRQFKLPDNTVEYCEVFLPPPGGFINGPLAVEDSRVQIRKPLVVVGERFGSVEAVSVRCVRSVESRVVLGVVVGKWFWLVLVVHSRSVRFDSTATATARGKGRKGKGTIGDRIGWIGSFPYRNRCPVKEPLSDTGLSLFGKNWLSPIQHSTAQYSTVQQPNKKPLSETGILYRLRIPLSPVSPHLLEPGVLKVPITMSIVVTQDPEQIDRPDEPWKYPYVAAVVDFGSNFTMAIRSEDQARVGYQINPRVHITNTDPAVMGFFEEFCENHGLNPRFRDRDNTFVMEVTRRDDLRDLLRLVAPYVIVRREVVAIMLDDLIPGLEARKQSDEAGFVELMGYVDQIREHTHGTGERKYTQDYFRDEFGL